MLLASFVYAGNVVSDDVTFDPVDSRLLPSNHVKCLYQDNEGFVWIGTNNGLARYDGSNVISYSGYIKEYSFLYEVIECYDGSLLLATDKGLVILDKVAGRAEAIIEGLAVSSLAKDINGNIWAGGEDGLFFCPVGGKTFEKVGVYISGQPLEGVIDIMADADGKIWMTTWQKGLYMYDPSTSVTQIFKKEELAYSYVLHQDSDGNIWVGTWGHGLLKLAADFQETSEYVLYPATSSDGTTLVDDVVYAINDVNGQILVGGQKGFSIMDSETGEMTFYAPGTPDGLPYNQVNSILVTANGNIFLGLYGGGMCSVTRNSIPYALHTLPDIRQRFGTSTVHSIFAADGSWLWMGIPDNGFILYDPLSHQVIKHNDMHAFKGMLSISTAFAIRRRTATGEICVGTYSEGLWIYNPATGKVKVYTTETCPTMHNNNILAIENDSYGNLWLGTKAGVYVLTHEDTMMSLEDFSAHIDPQTRIDGQIQGIACSEDGWVYLATTDHGCIAVNVSDRSVAAVSGDFFTVPYTNAIVDVNGDVWVGSLNDGLYFYDRSTGEFYARMPVEGLESNCITNIAQLPDGEIWVTTSNELLTFYPDSETDPLRITRYIADLGVDFTGNSSLVTEGYILFGTTEGVFNYDLNDRIIDPVHRHSLVITDLVINGRSYRTTGALDSDINYVGKVKVKKGDNVEIRYTLLDYNHFFSPIFSVTFDGKMRETAMNAVSFNVSRNRTEVEIAYLPSGQTKTLVLRSSRTLSYIIAIVIASLVSAGFYLFRRKKKPQREVIAFEVDKINFTSPDEELLQKAMEVIQKHINDADFKQDDFMKEMGMSRTQLTEKIKELTGFTPISLIMEVRLKTAYNSIVSAQEKLRISDVAYSVGFNDAKYFGTCFRKKYGLTPKELMTQRLEAIKDNANQ